MNNIDTFFLPYIHKFVPEWKELTNDDIKIHKTIGITNKTYIIESNTIPQRIIFRHFGRTGEGLFLNREQELKILEVISNNRMGPSYYGHQDDVRIEEYLENTVLQQEQMKDPQFYRKVAANLAKFHELQIDMDRTPLFQKHIQNNSKMMKVVREKLQSKLFNESEKEQLKTIQDWFNDKEIKFLQKHMPKDETSLVFSHNDLLANNVLITPPNDGIVFIDYEYASYNFRGFDIANYFIESQFNYTNPSPPFFYIENGFVDDEILVDFVKSYLENSTCNMTSDQLFKQLHIGMLLSHYFWAAWALNMAKQNDLDFDYLAFIIVRFHKYFQLKQHYFPGE